MKGGASKQPWIWASPESQVEFETLCKCNAAQLGKPEACGVHLVDDEYVIVSSDANKFFVIPLRKSHAACSECEESDFVGVLSDLLASTETTKWVADSFSFLKKVNALPGSKIRNLGCVRTLEALTFEKKEAGTLRDLATQLSCALPEWSAKTDLPDVDEAFTESAVNAYLALAASEKMLAVEGESQPANVTEKDILQEIAKLEGLNLFEDYADQHRGFDLGLRGYDGAKKQTHTISMGSIMNNTPSLGPVSASKQTVDDCKRASAMPSSDSFEIKAAKQSAPAFRQAEEVASEKSVHYEVEYEYEREQLCA